jgi:phosphoribosylformimino-5-aminoimidazole carboxamide ribotide isomerase
MRIYPAIDLMGGRCVRLKQGDFNQVAEHNEDPAAQALEWRAQGASFLHVVDLDGARSGFSANEKAIAGIMAAAGVPVQTGGGIRTMEDIERKLGMGVERVILGTAAAKDHGLVKEAVARFGASRVVAGVDAKGGKAAVSGWEEDSGKDVLELCLELKRLGIRLAVFTDISKDGMMEGFGLEATKRLIERSGLDVIASGGISSMEDLERARAIGAEGAIIGKALYIGAVSLREAVDAYEKDNPLP